MGAVAALARVEAVLDPCRAGSGIDIGLQRQHGGLAQLAKAHPDPHHVGQPRKQFQVAPVPGHHLVIGVTQQEAVVHRGQGLLQSALGAGQLAACGGQPCQVPQPQRAGGQDQGHEDRRQAQHHPQRASPLGQRELHRRAGRDQQVAVQRGARGQQRRRTVKPAQRRLGHAGGRCSSQRRGAAIACRVRGHAGQQQAVVALQRHRQPDHLDPLTNDAVDQRHRYFGHQHPTLRADQQRARQVEHPLAAGELQHRCTDGQHRRRLRQHLAQKGRRHRQPDARAGGLGGCQYMP